MCDVGKCAGVFTERRVFHRGIGEQRHPEDELSLCKRSILEDLVERLNESKLEEHSFSEACLVIPDSAKSEAADELLKHGVFNSWAVGKVASCQMWIECNGPDDGNIRWAAYLGGDIGWDDCLPVFWAKCPRRSLLMEDRDGKCVARSVQGGVEVVFEWAAVDPKEENSFAKSMTRLDGVSRLAELCQQADFVKEVSLEST